MDILFLFGVFGIFFHSLCKCNLLFLRHYVFLPLEFLFWYLFTTTFFSLLRFFFPLSFHYVSLYRYNSFFGIALRCFIFFYYSFYFSVFRYSCTAFFHYWNYFLLLEFIFLWNRKESFLSRSLSRDLKFPIKFTLCQGRIPRMWKFFHNFIKV